MKSKKQLALTCPFDNIRANARLIVAFSGFYESHKPPPLGNACGIVPPHRNGHKNGQQSGTYFIIVVLIIILAAAGAIRSK
jgi:hypothetical protein